MENLLSLLIATESELKKIGNEEIILGKKLLLLNQKIHYIFSKIKLCETLALANKYFNILAKIQFELEKIQTDLEKVIYMDLVEKMEIPARVWRFQKKFNKLNIESERGIYFEKIKKNEFLF